MVKLISFLFLVAGIGLASYGGFQYFQQEREAAFEEVAATAPPAPLPVEVVTPPPPPSPVLTPRSVEVRPFTATAPEPAAADGSTYYENLPVAYETPQSAILGQAFDVTFALDATGDDSARDALPDVAEAQVLEGYASATDRVKASLSGSGFDIQLLSPDIQRLSTQTENVWRWKVKPVLGGDQGLIVELFALEDEDSVEARPMRTFSDRITVRVSTFQRILGLVDETNPIFVMLGGIGSALAGFFGIFRFVRPGS